MKQAIINKIIPFSNVDGPGNRTAIFFQGCPFSCLYCHNPETINLCSDCGVCVHNCPTNALLLENNRVVWDKEKCCDCDICIKGCPTLSLPKAHSMEVMDIINYIKPHIAFIEGITVSGGECMLYADFLLELFKEAKKLDLTCLIDSNGAIDFSLYPELLAVCDGVMLDVKAVNESFHFEICQHSNDLVKHNLNYLQAIGKLFEVRTVLLPNQDEQNRNTVEYVSQNLQSEQILYKLLRYRPYGVRQKGLDYFGNDTVDFQYAEVYRDLALRKGHQNIVVV